VGGESRGARAVAFLTHKQGDLRGKAEPAPSAVLTSVFGEQHHPEEFLSALGQKRKFQSVRSMSALPPKADIRADDQDVRFVPKADSYTAAINALL